ncbi:MAG: DUF1501 domain-containing protein [Planctomycetota bacterium]|jgi:hypothetical protein|nr:DUF1501 domain-containing protein [Planctomycetota bacterium]MDP6762451.1 DUF1501 domain-containing protein [Planctomycetota bacterium]MDP6989267.1 DUF1501 domain-containing protein [Planctomycetota bacterium]
MTEHERALALQGHLRTLGRRSLLRGAGLGLASLALGRIARGDEGEQAQGLHHAPRARRVVHLFQSGGPSQLELFDHKPLLQERNGEELPDSVRRGQRLTGMSGNQASLPLAGAQFQFARHGESGAWMSELVPHTAAIADDLCIVRTVVTEAINHDPAATFLLTGSQIAGRPSMGAWLSYGLGTMNGDLPVFCVLVTKGKGGQPLYKRLWGSGFLSARHQGVQLRAGPDPVLYLNDPPGLDRATRRRMLDALREMHEDDAQRSGDVAPLDRIAQAELAFRLQSSVPEVADLSDEPDATFELYGEDARNPGTYAANCVLARRLIERDVRFVQLFHRGWDQHGSLPGAIRTQCRETDRASAALVTDLKRRGLLDDTLVVWGGEFGRTCYCQGKLTPTNYGRDHHPRCASVWMAGGGVRAGSVYGETDEFGYNIVRDPVHVHDLHATILHLLGVDHERLVHRHQGRRFRLTDVHGEVVEALVG